MMAGRWRGGAGRATGDGGGQRRRPARGLRRRPRRPGCVWVAGGLGWHADAVGCPSCERPYPLRQRSRWCVQLRLRPARPRRRRRAADDGRSTIAVLADGRRLRVALAIPGASTRATPSWPRRAPSCWAWPTRPRSGPWPASRGSPGGSRCARWRGCPPGCCWPRTRPASSELLDLVADGSGPVVVGINARVADGRDPSWLWDVPFERLTGRAVVATGERCADLSVRLRLRRRRARDAGATRSACRRPRGPSRRAARAARSSSSATTRRSTICCGPARPEPPDGPSAAHRRRLPRPPGHLRRRRQRAGPGPAGRAPWHRRRAAGGGERGAAAGSRHLLLGGGEDAPQVQAAESLVTDGAPGRGVAGGAVVLAVCAGYQIVGRSFPGGRRPAGPGPGPARRRHGEGPRAPRGGRDRGRRVERSASGLR